MFKPTRSPAGAPLSRPQLACLIALISLLFTLGACTYESKITHIDCESNADCPDDAHCDMNYRICSRADLPEPEPQDVTSDTTPPPIDTQEPDIKEDPGCEICEDGEKCDGHEDCKSGVCGDDGTCQEPSCDDEVQNGDELGVDCGGPCEPCDECDHHDQCVHFNDEDDEWGSCEPDGPHICDESGIRHKTRYFGECVNKRCKKREEILEEECGRSTDGTSCQSDEPGDWSACEPDIEATDSCHTTTGTKTRQVTVYECRDGGCHALPEKVKEEKECDYTFPDGTPCDETSQTSWSACSNQDGCNTDGTRNRTITRHSCQSGQCVDEEEEEIEDCDVDVSREDACVISEENIDGFCTKADGECVECLNGDDSQCDGANWHCLENECIQRCSHGNQYCEDHTKTCQRIYNQSWWCKDP